MSPLADPVAAAAYNRERWQRYGPVYRASRTPPPPPLSRYQALAEDIRQAEALAEVEARRIGRERARQRLAAWLAGERRWIQATSSRYTIGGLDAGED